MLTNTRNRLKSLEVKATPLMAGSWLRRQIENEQSNGRVLDVLYLLINWEVLLCPDEEVELLYQRHYQSNDYPVKDENTDRTEYAIAALCCALEAFSIYKQPPAEFLAPNAKETLAKELRELLSNIRFDVKAWSTKTLFRALHAIESYIEHYPRQPGSARVIVDTARFIKNYDAVHSTMATTS